MQLGVAKEELSSKEGDPCYRIQRAVELANIGLAEACRCAHDLRLSNVDESGLAVALQGLAERASLAGRLRCDFQSANVPEKSLPPRLQHELLRIAQEAIHNAVRHANPTLIAVSLLWDAPNLVLQVKSKIMVPGSSGFPWTKVKASDWTICGREPRRSAEKWKSRLLTVTERA